MKKQNLFLISCALLMVFTSCKGPQQLLKPEAKIDTLNLQLDMRLVQVYEYRAAIEKKMQKFVDVYNTESHPFKLSLNSGSITSVCNLDIMRAKFVSKKQSNLHLAYSVAGVGTFATLLATGFPVPVGWVFIPRARTTLEPKLSSDIANAGESSRVGIISGGMYRTQEKQIDMQSTKFVKYVVSIVQSVEEEYKKNKGN
ncbi:MAG: hypothetical protein K2X48_09785 [Chitinophagaceae bacterium]|nr:hypothetical protein [Chitinophagaceae bacterium]